MSGLKQEWKNRTKVGSEVEIHFNGAPYKGTVIDRNIDTIPANAVVVLKDGDDIMVVPAFSSNAVLVVNAPEKKKDTDMGRKEKMEDSKEKEE